MNAHVAIQVVLNGERKSADTTRVRFVAGMGTVVQRKVALCGKLLMADAARICFFVAVQHHVLFQLRLIRKRLRADNADERTDSRVRSDVRRKRRLLTETLLTDLTDVWFFPGVDFPVHVQGTVRRKRLVTDLALGSLGAVRLHVQL